jgi:hypothetical protein
MNLDYLGVFSRRSRRRQSGREEEVQDLCEDARGGKVGIQTLPMLPAHARFFDELALCRDHGWLVGFELPRRQLPDPTSGHVAILT